MQVIHNLQSNAIKHTMSGVVTIIVSLQSYDNTAQTGKNLFGVVPVNDRLYDKYLKIQVIDTGVGISKEN